MGYVTIEKVSKSFQHQTVLHELQLTINKGEFVTLLGPSGCGKSTLLRIVAGLTNPEQGIIKIDGQDITNVLAKDRQVGMVFQSYALFPNMTVEENIAFGLTMKKLSKTVIQEKVANIIELVGLSEKEKAYPRELSGGQQQRVALARSLVTEPKVLLLDEPLSALDAQIRKNLQKQLRMIQQKLNMTMILVTHDQEEAMAVSDRIYILNAGHIAQSGTPHEIYTHPVNEFVARFIGNYNVLDKKQMVQLIGEKKELTTNLYAIRPEAFSTLQVENSYELSGKVLRTMMLGKVIRYEMDCFGIPVVVEQLHHSSEHIQMNETLNVYLRKQDVIALQ